jgi:hypothetical protein
MRIIEEPYWTPEGTVDTPFSYVFDGSTLTDGANLQNIAVQLQGDSDFILRRIVGVPTCVAAAPGGKMNYKNASGTYTAGNPSTGIIFPNTWPVVPEKLYRVNDQISFDLYDILRAKRICTEGTIYTGAQIAFQGVKRFGRNSTYPRQVTPYKYREVTYKYAFELTINFAHFNSAGVANPAQTFYQPMDNFDFELLAIRISQPGAAGALQANDFQIMLFDSNQHQFSTIPLNQGFINAGRPNPANAPQYQASFPTPSQIYPAGGAIRFDITSMLCSASLPQTYEIEFDGIWRYPC